MADDNQDYLESLLEDGWQIAGFSNTMMAAGAMTHTILLQKENRLISAIIVANGAKEIGRNFLQISPAPTQKKGWF